MQKLTPEQMHAWRNDWYDTKKSGGRFERSEALYRNWVTRDGAAGSTGSDGFKAESGRYHLYISMACPWAHRTLLTRKLKGLEAHISVSNTLPYMGPQSWSFEPEQGRLFRAAGEGDYYIEYLYELYRLVDPEYKGRATVPVLWDKQRQTIVSNESAEIVRMLNSEFAAITEDTHPDTAHGTPTQTRDTHSIYPDLYPEPLRAEIDHWNELLYPSVNNGVYRSGFATTQEAYKEAVYALFAMLDKLEEHLATHRYLTGKSITEADLRLFPTLVRFDAVYFGHFKCNIRRISDYPNLWAYTRDIYQLPGVAETVDIDYNKAHYYGSHETVNPTLIIPVGPILDFMAPHQRDQLTS